MASYTEQRLEQAHKAHKKKKDAQIILYYERNKELIKEKRQEYLERLRERLEKKAQ